MRHKVMVTSLYSYVVVKRSMISRVCLKLQGRELRRLARLREAADLRPPPHGGVLAALRHLRLRPAEARPATQEPSKRHLARRRPDVSKPGGGKNVLTVVQYFRGKSDLFFYYAFFFSIR